MLDEGIVLLGSTFCQWLEPVSVVGYAILVSPLLDAFGYGVGDVTVETSSVVDDIHQFLIDICRRYLYIFCRLNTFFPKNSLGRSLGAVTSTGFLLEASETTSNLKLLIPYII